MSEQISSLEPDTERKSKGERSSELALRFYEKYIIENESEIADNKESKDESETIKIAIRCIGTKVNQNAEFKGKLLSFFM